MSNFTIKLDKRFDKLIKALQAVDEGWLDKDTAKLLGEEVTFSIRELTLKGISPIQGKGKFPAYKDKTKYPGKRKGATPVNLRMSGKFMSSLAFRIEPDKKGYRAIVFFDTGKDPKANDKEKGHREGANTQPKRPIFPEGSEKLSASINKNLADILKQRLINLILGNDD